MQISIQILTVEDENRGKYNMLTVNYKDLGLNKVSSKKLMSFKFPDLYKTLKSASGGDTFKINTEKNGEYRDWVSIVDGDSAPTTNASPSTGGSNKAAGNPTPKSTYETAEERAARQRLIVRQSSLTAAINILNSGTKKVDAKEVYSLAEDLTAWVFETGKVAAIAASVTTSIDDISDDIPL